MSIMDPTARMRRAGISLVFRTITFALCACVVGPIAAEPSPQNLNYRTTWLGNSFGGGPKWVQNFNEQMQVLPDGTVYLASFWDEGGREVGVYRDGDVHRQIRAHPTVRGGYAVALGGGYGVGMRILARGRTNRKVKGRRSAVRRVRSAISVVSRYTLDGAAQLPFAGGKTPYGQYARVPRGA